MLPECHQSLGLVLVLSKSEQGILGMLTVIFVCSAHNKAKQVLTSLHKTNADLDELEKQKMALHTV